MTSGFLLLPKRRLIDAEAENIGDRIDAIETLTEQAVALRGKALKWAGDDLEEFLHYMDEAIGAAQASLTRLHDALPHHDGENMRAWQNGRVL